MDIMKAFIKKFIPTPLLGWYHRALAAFGAFWYGFPSEKMVVIGVTGTNGKSTVGYFIAKIFDHIGAKSGLTSTAVFKIADREWLNDKKMTMLGRFQLQRMLRDMVRAGCQYAVVETSSEGIKQYRHRGINYDVAVFTNLTPEHLEAHGGFEQYKQAKGELFAWLA
ncbi:MAG: Mur ligase family protein, partial [Patescibacteria group bacterium]